VEATVSINSRFWRYSGAVSAILAITQLAGCSTEDTDPAGTGGSSGATNSGGAGGGGQTGGSSNAGMGGGAPAGSICANPVALGSTYTLIGEFDTWDGTTELSKWSYALGGDSATGVYAGPFGYGDRTGNKAETFDLFEGQGSTKYGMRVADSKAENFGGGLGIWLSTCINATAFSGVSFWARGDAPTGKATFKISMGETTSSTPSDTGAFGTCAGTSTTCIHPSYEFAVSDEWTEFKVPWSAFKAGDAAGTAVTPNGRNIMQFGFDIGLVWAPGSDGVTYMPTPAPYELRIDTVKFY
jgi:hypothetical protein